MYGFVIHGAIDGYSRRVLMLRANTDNRSATVLQSFRTDVVRRFGVPLCLRTDRGGENVDTLTYMFAQRGNDTRRPAIVGTSTRNQRIERLWGDVNRVCTGLYINVFAEWTWRYPTWFPRTLPARMIRCSVVSGMCRDELT